VDAIEVGAGPPGGETLTDEHPDAFTVGDGDVRALRRVAEELAAGHPQQLTAVVDRRFDDPPFLTALEGAARRLSAPLLERLVGFRLQAGACGFLALRGLPVDEPLPPTPADGSHRGAARELFLSSVVQLMVMSVLGGVISYADEKDGRLIQDVSPVPGAEDRQENTGSTLLELHTEDGFHPHKPDFLSLYCLRGDSRGQALTVVAGVRRVLPDLPAQCRAVLRRPLFRVRLSSSFVGDGPARYSPAMPVLSGPADDPELCLDMHAMEALDGDSAAALRLLSDLMQRRPVMVDLRPGDLIVVDNRVAVHGRTAFAPRFDGTDRWLRRCYAVADLRRSRGARYPDSRMHRPL
jgi:L-asparagine oxygenase